MHILDHNVLIDVEKKTRLGMCLLGYINAEPKDYSVVNIGASELRIRGVRPDSYSLFELFLERIGLHGLQRLDPLGLINITFIDHCLVCSDAEVDLYLDINNTLFPSGYVKGEGLIRCGFCDPIERKRLNQICDAVGLWCHIKYKTDGFVTSDKNFIKKSGLVKCRYGANVVSASLFL
jgi:hypothetical protein